MKKRIEPFGSDFYDKEYFEGGLSSLKKAYSGYGNEITEKDLEYNSILWLIDRFKLNQNKKVLELGCATGRKVLALRRLGIEARGMDISEYAINKAHEEVKPYLLCRSCEKIPFNSDSLDLIFGYDLLEHLTEEQINSVIKESTRVSNHVFFHFYIGENKDQGDISDQDKVDASHISVYSENWWKNKIESLTDLSWQYGVPGTTMWVWIWKNLDIDIGAGKYQRIDKSRINIL